MALSLNWLRSFEAAARLQSFTGAAEELNISQAAISQQVRLLEDYAGIRLFNRLPRGVSLTEAGRRLFVNVAGGLALLERSFTDDLKSSASTVEVRCNTGFALFWLNPRLTKFLESYPDTSLSIATALWPSEFNMSAAMVEIRRGLEDRRHENGVRLADDLMFPVCAPERAPAIPDAASLERQTLILVRPALERWEDWARAVGMPRLRPASKHYVDSQAFACQLARSGTGVALGGRILCRDMIRRGELVAPLDLKVSTRSAYWSILRRPDVPAARAFHEWLVARIGEEFGPVVA